MNYNSQAYSRGFSGLSLGRASISPLRIFSLDTFFENVLTFASSMNLEKHLSQKKSSIADRWVQLIFDSFKPETSDFLKREKDRFNNPLGFRISRGIKGLCDVFLENEDSDKALACLDEVIGIRALQDFPPSQALAFVFLLKKVVREELAPELRDPALREEFLELESRIDGLALLGFDVYMKRRERLCDIKVEEMKKRVGGLLRKAGIDLDNP